MPSLCATFRREAGVVWNRMHSAADLGLSLSEETLTECALYDIARVHQGADIVIDMATKPAEAKHGADWEWWFVRANRAIGFRVQAKRLFANGRYSSLLKAPSNPYAQLDKLVSKSAQDGCEPIYCFYNFSHPLAVPQKHAPCKHSYHGPSFWGCALASPDQVKKANSDEYAKLRPLMRPWHTLVCQSSGAEDLVSAAGRFVVESGMRDEPLVSEIPPRVRRLLELGDERRASGDRSYLDFSYWDGLDGASEDLAGLVTFRDERE